METIHIVPMEPLGKSPVTEFSQFGNGPVLAVTADHKLYQLNGETWSAISTPATMRVVDAAFRSQNEGMVIGTTTNNPGSGGGSFIIGWVILGFLIAIIGGSIYAIVRLIRRKRWKILSLVGLGIIAIIALFLHFVKVNNTTSRTFSFDAGTHYVGETGQPGNLVALTSDGGAHWRSFSLRTNFYLTACAPVDSAYLVTTYASPDHLDGDLWRIPVDSAIHPGLFAAARALWGIAEADSTIFAYGTDISVAHIGNPWQSVRGEVFRTNDRLDTVTVLNTSSKGGIVSLSAIESSTEFWAVTRDHILKRYSNEDAATVPFVPGSLPLKIAAVSSNIVTVLDSVGRVFVSRDTGHSWQKLPQNAARVTAIASFGGTLYVGDDSGNVFRVSFQ